MMSGRGLLLLKKAVEATTYEIGPPTQQSYVRVWTENTIIAGLIDKTSAVAASADQASEREVSAPVLSDHSHEEEDVIDDSNTHPTFFVPTQQKTRNLVVPRRVSSSSFGTSSDYSSSSSSSSSSHSSFDNVIDTPGPSDPKLGRKRIRNPTGWKSKIAKTLRNSGKLHREWRKIAKRERRRRIRIKNAIEAESTATNTIIDIEEWKKIEADVEEYEIEVIKKQNEEENEKWIKADKMAVEQWHLLQEKKAIMYQKQLEQEAKKKIEWEKEKQRRKEEAQRLKEIEEANKKKQEKFMKNLEQFLNGDLDTAPAELLISHETKPNADLCPFFSKTGCCRFGDQCSRNHQYPGISKVLMACNFYMHFGLENANYNEYDTDLMLEYEESDTYKEFKEFFYDILPEFEKFGKIVQLKVCNNHEKHLRGNTYVEYADLRNAVAAYRGLHTRWYGGKQLSLQFCQISSWKNAICGLQSRKRCPKGRACNFLHVFRNPNNLFNSRFSYSERSSSPSTDQRSWRWSESPERESPRVSSKSRDRNHTRRDHRRDSDRRRSRRSHRRRSRSRD